MDKFKELGKIILSDLSKEKSMKFRKITPTCPAYESRMVFMDENKEKEWEELDEKTKSEIMRRLHKTTEAMEVRLAIELLCHCINELNDKLNFMERKLT